MLSLFQLIAALLTVTAVFAWLNHRFLHLPATIGLLVMGLGASLLLIAFEFLLPHTQIYGALAETIGQIDFYEAVMHGMLGFLLFAGALQVNLDRLRERAMVVGILAMLGTPLAMVLVATGFWLVTQALGLPIDFLWCLVFGAVVAPTDPVAVLSTLKQAKVPKTLETDMSGESLFNDGVGVVLFTIAVQAAVGSGAPGSDGGGGEEASFGAVMLLLLVEAGGGALFGLATGYIAYRGLRAIDDYAVEVMISLALVSGTYVIADSLHMSGPIAVVVAGVLIGNHGVAHGMSQTTRRYVLGFWTLLDEILNAVLFLLIGLEVVVLSFDPAFGWLALAAIPLAVLARFLSVAGPITLLRRWYPFVRGTIPVMTWGGIRGGISVALALSLPDSPARTPILAATYAVVLFTVVAQGLSFGGAVRRAVKREEPAA